MPDNVVRDQNRVTGLLAESSDGDGVVVPLRADPITKRLLVDITGAVGGGTEYTEGDSDTSFSGFVLMAEAPGNLAATLKVNADGELTVDYVGGATEAKQDTIITHIDGIEALLATIDSSLALLTDAIAGSEIQVDIVAALPAGTNTIGAVEVDGVAGSHGQVTINTTANGVEVTAASAGRMGILLRNQGSVDCYVGCGNVATNTGMLLEAGETMYLPTDSQVKAITASSSTTLSYITFA